MGSGGRGYLGRFSAPFGRGEAPDLPPPTTAHGALLAHITGGHVETIDAGPRSFQPMNVNFGLFPPLEKSPGGAAKAMAKRRALTARALHHLDSWTRGCAVVEAAQATPPIPAPEGASSAQGHPQ